MVVSVIPVNSVFSTHEWQFMNSVPEEVRVTIRGGCSGSVRLDRCRYRNMISCRLYDTYPFRYLLRTYAENTGYSLVSMPGSEPGLISRLWLRTPC